LYDALSLLQHRGQDAAGIATCHEGRLILRRGAGLVRDVFKAGDMLKLEGRMGIGHVRYPTAGTTGQAESQPFYVNSPYGIVMGHNGNLTNADALQRELFDSDLRHINTRSDSEVLLNVFAHELQDLRPSTVLTPDMIFATVAAVHRRCKGAYAVIGMIVERGVFAFRDPLGIRPAVIGQRVTDSGTEYAIASESVALQGLGFSLLRDVAPGEAVYIDMEGNLHTQQCAQNPALSPCIFEYVYLARPDSIIDNISVYKARLRMGETLARRILQLFVGLHLDRSCRWRAMRVPVKSTLPQQRHRSDFRMFMVSTCRQPRSLLRTKDRWKRSRRRLVPTGWCIRV